MSTLIVLFQRLQLYKLHCDLLVLTSDCIDFDTIAQSYHVEMSLVPSPTGGDQMYTVEGMYGVYYNITTTIP